MKGIILAGGTGSRLYPLTKITSKQLLPIYDRPMIFYPIMTLVKAGITDILIIVSPEHCGDFMEFLGSGSEYGARFTYEVQDKPEGLAQAFLIASDFIGGEPSAMILGDNLFFEDFSKVVRDFRSGATIFAKQVPDPERFGVVEFDDSNNVLSIEEKPTTPKSHFAQTGLYLFDSRVVSFARGLKPSARGELEITDLTNRYLALGELSVRFVENEWIDAGTFESLRLATETVRRHRKNDTAGQVTIGNIRTRSAA